MSSNATQTPFRKLTKKEKWQVIENFCNANKRLPKTHRVHEDERVLGQFWINSKSSLTKTPGKHEQWERAIFDKLCNHCKPRLSRMQKITTIVNFAKEHKRTPSQASKNESEKRLGQLLNTLKTIYSNDKMTSDEATEFSVVMAYRNNYQRSRAEKLNDVLEFCNKYSRTPRQHVSDKEEKRLAEFFSTTKLYAKNYELALDEQSLFDKILTFAPLSKDNKMTALLSFARTNKRPPKMNSDNIEERVLATFFTKLKSTNKSGTIKHTEKVIFDTVVELCHIKTRSEKIHELGNWIGEHKAFPKLNSDASDERKLAMFMNNMKQAHKNQKLNDAEITLLMGILNTKVDDANP